MCIRAHCLILILLKISAAEALPQTQLGICVTSPQALKLRLNGSATVCRSRGGFLPILEPWLRHWWQLFTSCIIWTFQESVIVCYIYVFYMRLVITLPLTLFTNINICYFKIIIGYIHVMQSVKGVLTLEIYKTWT